MSNMKAIDLGLSVKWASQNLGAASETDCGSYFSWGSIEPDTNFILSKYKWYDATTGTYNIPSTNISGTQYDAATSLLGKNWRMPTEDEMNELVNKCTWTKAGNGFKVKGTNGNEIFLPFTGFYSEDSLVDDNKCYYWSGSYNTLPVHEEDYWAYYLTNYTSNSEYTPTVISRYIYNGLCIRPVYDENYTPAPTPDTPSDNKYAVDLGLSVKWAKWNIGASSEGDYGNYIAWGDPTGKNASFISSDYPNDYNDISGTKYDTATSLWGKDWRMPTPAEWKELDSLTKELVTLDNGVKAFKVMASNGNYIYLPRGGYKTSKGLQEQNVGADYWTSENTSQTFAKGVMIGKVSSTFEPEDQKGWHMLVRAVCDRSANPVAPNPSSDDCDPSDESREKLINDYNIIFKSSHYKKQAIDFTEPWNLFNTKNQREFITNKNNRAFLDNYANFKNTVFKGDFTINYWKGNSYYDWSSYINSLYLRFEAGAGFTAKSDAAQGNFISAIDFGAGYSQIDRRHNVGVSSSGGKTLWVAGSYAQPEVDFYYRDPGLSDVNALVKTTLYGFNLDDVPSPGSSFDYAVYNEIEASGYEEAMFNFTRPHTLDLFSNTLDNELPYSNLQDKIFKKGVVSISFSMNPNDSIENKNDTLLIPGEDNLYYKKAGVPRYFAMTGNGTMFTISVENGYKIKNIVFLDGIGWGHTLLVNGEKVLHVNEMVNDHSLPIYPKDQDGIVWQANDEDLMSVSFASVNEPDASNEIWAIAVGYVKNGSITTPPTPPSIDTDDSDKDVNGNNTNKPDQPSTPDTPSGDNNNTSKETLTLTDTNDMGYSVDPNVILYAGGQEVIPQTMTQKDNTLFLGNYKESNKVFSQDILDFIKNNSVTKFTSDFSPAISKGETGSLYMYDNQLGKSSYDITSFKGGEVYRFGLVFQNNRGEWSDVVYVGDYQNDLYPEDSGTSFKAPKARITINSSAVAKLYDMGYRKAKAVVVYPSINNRLTICQGVLCPTVYNINSRKSNSPYAMSSWFFREMHTNMSINNVGTQNKHNYNIYNDINDYIPIKDRVYSSDNFFSENGLAKSGVSQFRAEISCADINNYYSYNSDDPQNMYVDWNTVTMNTPEVDFSLEDSSSSIPTENLKLRIIGIIPLTSNASDIYVNTSTQPLKVASFTGLHNTNDNHSNINTDAGTPRLTKFDWYDYDYHQETTDKKRTDWNIDKQVFETSDDYDLNRNQTLQEAFKQDITGVKVYKDHKVYPLYPWQGAKSLVGQYKAKDDNGMIYSALRKKVISNIRTSAFTYYFPDKSLSYDIGNVGLYSGDIPLVKLSSDVNDVDHAGQFNYYGEMDTILSPRDYYQTYHGLLIDYSTKSYNLGSLEEVSEILPMGKTNDPVRMKYKSSPHLACHLNYTKDGKQELLPKFNLRSFVFGDQGNGDAKVSATTFSGEYYVPGWSDRVLDKTSNNPLIVKVSSLHQNTIDLSYPSFPLFNSMDYMTSGFMYIGEFYKEAPTDLSTLFGGKTPMALEKNQWHTAGPTMALEKGSPCTVKCLQGDTYYQRYDSLKTYPYTDEDPNQIVEILSFMCETRMNIDGRYDSNRGLYSNLYMNNVNFNLFNPAYTQQDSFFNYYFLDPERNDTDTYPNDFIWTKTKTMGEEIDTWSNINSVSSYSLDGDKGNLNSIVNYNDSLLTFQDTGIARIMYNDRVQVSASDGVPIELANSQKVSGKQYLSNTIGCSNKDTIQITPNGVYFMDSNSKDLYLFGNGMNSLTKAKGFNNYLYDKDISKYKTFYDKKLKDVYFIDDTECLDFNEQLNEFEGFYDYEGTDYMFNYNDSFIGIKGNTIWKQYAGDYNMFYGSYKPFWLTFISNDGNVDKTFNTVEFEADSWDKDNNIMSDTFDHLSVWDEYQVGECSLRSLNMNNHYHFSNLKRKFRIWRANIPREVKLKDITFPDALSRMQRGDISTDTGKVLNMVEGLNRIRNTWAYIRLKKNNENTDKTILHGLKVSYLY